MITGRQVKALIVSNQNDVVNRLQQILNRIGIATDLARTCGHARTMLEQANPAELIFSDSILPDGSWAGVIGMTAAIAEPVPVIVVSQVRDYQTVMDAMEAGAADCIGPPFLDADVAWVVHNALDRGETLWNRGD